MAVHYGKIGCYDTKYINGFSAFQLTVFPTPWCTCLHSTDRRTSQRADFFPVFGSFPVAEVFKIKTLTCKGIPGLGGSVETLATRTTIV